MNLKTVPGLCVALFAASQSVQAQFSYSVNSDNTATITGYTGSGGAVTIPAMTNGLTVTGIQPGAFIDNQTMTSVTIADGLTTIGENAFESCGLTNISIPNSVTSIGQQAFLECSLTSILIPGSVTSIAVGTFNDCESLTNATIGNGVLYVGETAFDGCEFLTSVTIAGSVTSIGQQAFENCNSLTSIVIPANVTSIEDDAFENCGSLTSVLFTGNPPIIVGSDIFQNDNSNPTVYYLPSASGWHSPFANRQTLLWNPLIQTTDGSFGVRSNQFGFNVTGTPYIPVVVEACTNLANPVWTPLQTVTLTNGSFYFREPIQTNCTGRYYGLGLP